MPIFNSTKVLGDLVVTGDINTNGDIKINGENLTAADVGAAPLSHTHTYGDLTGVVPTWNQSTTGNAATATVVNGTSGQLTSKDDRIIEPNSITAGRLQFGFTSFDNNNITPYADYLHLRSYQDATGGLDNLVMFRKDVIGMRIYQQTFGSATAYSTFKDVAFTDSNISGTAGVSTTATITHSSTNSAFKVPFANTTGASATGNYGLLQDTENTFTYNPSTNTLIAGTFSGSGASLTSLPAGNLTGNISIDRLPTITVAKGGTGATDAATARTNLGLGNVDNTSDVNKPVSTATQNALNLKVNTSAVGALNGVASLDSGGKVPFAQLPSSVTGGMRFGGSANLTAGTTEALAVGLNTIFTELTYANFETTGFESRGLYRVVINPGFVKNFEGTDGSVAYFRFQAGTSSAIGEEGDDTSPIYLEKGDWIVLNSTFSPAGGVKQYYFSIINNTYADATSVVKGVVTLSQSTSLQDDTNAVITESVLQGLLGTGADQLAVGNHTHAIANVTGLQDALNAKLNLTGGTMTGALTIDRPMQDGTNAYTSPHLVLSSTNTTDTTGFVGMVFDTSTSANFGWSYGAQRTTDGNGDLIWRNHDSNTAGVERMRLLDNGNLGIGTTSPTAKLSINVTGVNGTRENILNATVSDDVNSRFVIANGTIGDGVFAPAFGGISSANSLWGVKFTGFTTSANDASNSSNFGLVDFEVLRTSSSTDPFNGTPTNVVNRRAFTFRNLSNNLMNIMANGNVGIGSTTSPTKLFVLDTVNTTAALGTTQGNFGVIKSDGNTTTGNYGLMIGVLGSGESWLQAQRTDGVATAYSLLLQPANGNVGIGTDGPSEKLTVRTNTRYAATFNTLVTTDNQTSISLGGFSNAAGGTGGSVSINAHHNHAGNALSAISFSTFDGGLFERMRITSTGNVGIGTTAPDGKLTLIGDTASDNGVTFRIQSASGATRNLLFMGASSTQDSSHIQSYKDGTGAGTKNLLLNPLGGNVGIGTTTPAARLDVAGGINVQGNILLTGTATTTNQGRMIDFTGFDKEGTTDFSDRAYIQHTVNTGGHAGSVLEISSQNDTNDGIAFTTNASSQIRHNGHVMWDAGNDGTGSGLDADLLDGFNSSVASTANTVVVRDANAYIYASFFNSSRADQTTAAASYIYDTGDGWMRKKTLANAQAEIVSSAAVTAHAPSKTGTGASGTWGINVTGSAATLTTARTLTIGSTGKTFNGSADVSWSLTDIGLGNVTNESKATMFASPTFTGTVTGVTKTHVGLGNVDNTSDANKPVSTAQQTALDLKLNTSLKGANSGLAELDSSGKVPAAQLPSYVDDVVMFDPANNTLRFASTDPTTSTSGSLNEVLYSFQSSSYYICVGVTPPTYTWTGMGGGGTIPADGFETGKIYVATTSNKTYRWSSAQPKDGTIVEISASLALGSTSATAHRGDHGATAYTHSQVTNGTNPHNTTFANIASKPTTLSGYGITDAAISTHTHGNILGNGTITSTATIASGDRLIIGDAGTITQSSITFGTATTTFLRNDGTWQTGTGAVQSVDGLTGAVVTEALTTSNSTVNSVTYGRTLGQAIIDSGGTRMRISTGFFAPTGSSTSSSISFGTTFAAVPMVTVFSLKASSTTNTAVVAKATAVTTTGATVTCSFVAATTAGYTPAAETYGWIAIGY